MARRRSGPWVGRDGDGAVGTDCGEHRSPPAVSLRAWLRDMHGASRMQPHQRGTVWASQCVDPVC